MVAQPVSGDDMVSGCWMTKHDEEANEFSEVVSHDCVL